MLKRMPTPFGMAVKTRLMELGQRQEEKTGMYVDSSTMYKLLTGQLNSRRLQAAVRDILDLQEDAGQRIPGRPPDL